MRALAFIRIRAVSCLLPAILSVFLPWNSYATPTAEQCGGYTIVYGNGIMNSQADYIAGRNTLASIFGETHKGLPLDYGNAIDPSNGYFLDLLSVMQQEVDLYEDNGLTWSAIADIFLGLNVPWLLASIVSSVGDSLQTFLVGQTVSLLQQYINTNTTISSVVVNHVSLYEELILENRQRVLVVSHSQGTLYANTAYSATLSNPNIPQRSLGLVSAAALVPSIADGQGRYVTSSKDLAVYLLRANAAPTILPANASNSFTTSDPLGHNFLTAYLENGSQSRSMLIPVALEALDNLENLEWRVEQPLRMITRLNFSYPTCSYLGQAWEWSNFSMVLAGPPAVVDFYNDAIDQFIMSFTTPSLSNYTYSSQGFTDPYGFPSNESAFQTALNSPAQFAAVKQLDKTIASGEMVNLTAWQYAGPTENCSGYMSPGSAGDVGSAYDSTYLQPALAALQNYENVRLIRTTSGWPNKNVLVNICQSIPE